MPRALPQDTIAVMQKLTLTEANVIDILDQSIAAKTPVAMVALDYNWGPPVSGRFDTDFVQIWAAARIDLHPRQVKLLLKYHWQPQNWSEDLAFSHICDRDTHSLYFLGIPFPIAEFVIKLETENSQFFYDNNGGYGCNYRLEPYSGRGTTAVAGDGAIWNFPTITQVRLLYRRHE